MAPDPKHLSREVLEQELAALRRDLALARDDIQTWRVATFATRRQNADLLQQIADFKVIIRRMKKMIRA